MKKLYYVIPFILIPPVVLLGEYLCFEVADLPFIATYLCAIIVLALISAIMGNLSPSHKKFDYMIPIIMVLSLFLFQFMDGFLQKDDMDQICNWHMAFLLSTNYRVWIAYGVMALTSFLASFQPIRMAKWSHSHKN